MVTASKNRLSAEGRLIAEGQSIVLECHKQLMPTGSNLMNATAEIISAWLIGHMGLCPLAAE